MNTTNDPLHRDWNIEGYFLPGDTISVVSEPEGRTVSGFKELWVWKQGMTLTSTIYRLTRKFPKDEMFGLTSQLRRAAVSVPSNVAEGWARNRIGFFQMGLTYARGSVAEIETQLLIAVDQEYITMEEAKPVIDLLNGLSSALLKFLGKLEERKGR
ncbi:MAG: four helix bundle protein [Flavobacteriales bacterium]|nr:four helix bundle protein [Flavobacteriales bacterium]